MVSNDCSSRAWSYRVKIDLREFAITQNETLRSLLECKQGQLSFSAVWLPSYAMESADTLLGIVEPIAIALLPKIIVTRRMCQIPTLIVVCHRNPRDNLIAVVGEERPNMALKSGLSP